MKEKHKVKKKPIKLLKAIPIICALKDKGNNASILKYLRVKGTQCVVCGAVATELVKYINENGNKCYHVFGINTDGKEVRFSLDHIIPKSKGGTKHLSNIQIMCELCNSKKGNTFSNKKILWFIKLRQWLHKTEQKVMLFTYSLLERKH